MGKTYKSILDFFGVRSQRELLEFIENNPDNPKTIELKSLINSLDGDVDEKKPV